MIVIGLTGGMASGKSACARYLKSRGVAVLDADEISRELTRGNNLGARRIRQGRNRPLGFCLSPEY